MQQMDVIIRRRLDDAQNELKASIMICIRSILMINTESSKFPIEQNIKITRK
jgi:hypothetical protein